MRLFSGRFTGMTLLTALLFAGTASRLTQEKFEIRDDGAHTAVAIKNSKMSDTPSKGFCCSSKSTMCYWLAVFAIVYGIGLGLAIWLHAQVYELAILFGAIGLACLTNFARNRVLHCMITGPFFLLAAIAVALEVRGTWRMGAGFLWPVILVVVGTALLLERRFAR